MDQKLKRKAVLVGALVLLAMFSLGKVASSSGLEPDTLQEKLVIETGRITYVVLPGSKVFKFPVAVDPNARKAITQVQVRVSNYYPPAGGANCSDFRDNYCQSRMASGARWEDYLWRQPGAAACISDWEFGTTFTLPDGSQWICLDRGGSINAITGPPWVDLLEQHPRYDYGSVVWATIREK
ncbi:MAG: hypothetical protein QF704_00085 [Anaerolineales bacterium]|jgi:hypothetical protein|nr:hypothetical protein [Anaerolineales bacterium]